MIKILRSKPNCFEWTIMNDSKIRCRKIKKRYYLEILRSNGEWLVMNTSEISKVELFRFAKMIYDIDCKIGKLKIL
jgi:hypothetical protein